MSESDSTRVFPDQALLLRTRQLMGQTAQYVTPRGVIELPSQDKESQGFEVAPASRQPQTENVSESDQLVFRFPAALIGRPLGSLVLSLRIVEPAQLTITRPQGNVPHFTVRQVVLESEHHRRWASLAVLPDVRFDFRWGYSRHARMRLACDEGFDSTELLQLWKYHATWLRKAAQPLQPLRTFDGYDVCEVEFSNREIEEAGRIDRCEAVLDELDQHFCRSGDYLDWDAELFTEAALESRLQSFDASSVNVILRKGQQQWVFGKAVRPVVEVPVTISRQGKPERCARIGISID